MADGPLGAIVARRNAGFFSTSRPMSPHCGSLAPTPAGAGCRRNLAGDHLVETRTKAKAAERKTAPLAKADVKRSTRVHRSDAGDDAKGGQRVGVQSLGRAFGILEEAVSYTHLRAHETGRNLVC